MPTCQLTLPSRRLLGPARQWTGGLTMNLDHRHKSTLTKAGQECIAAVQHPPPVLHTCFSTLTNNTLCTTLRESEAHCVTHLLMTEVGQADTSHQAILHQLLHGAPAHSAECKSRPGVMQSATTGFTQSATTDLKGALASLRLPMDCHLRFLSHRLHAALHKQRKCLNLALPSSYLLLY